MTFFRLRKSNKRNKSSEPTLAETLASNRPTAADEEAEFEEACFQSQMELAMEESRRANPEDAKLLAVLEASKLEAEEIAKEDERQIEASKNSIRPAKHHPTDIFYTLPSIV
mmetsp:Transcript_18085/g.23431  ORF Transcript_18085/g.23431 Transcript_18085/m.23431 type:complete len:112 (+) Transcript_18085:88-423(+)